MASAQPSTSRLHALQVRAFLSASEDVDIDEEIILDILQNQADGEDEIVDVSGYFVDEESILDEDHDIVHEVDSAHLDGRVEHDDSDESEPEDEFEEEGTKPAFRLHLYYMLTFILFSVYTALSAWSPQQVKGMMHHLKEKGK